MSAVPNAAESSGLSTDTPSISSEDESHILDVDGKLIDYGHGSGSASGADCATDSGNTRYKTLNYSASETSSNATWFDANDSEANYQNQQQERTFQRLKQIDDGNYRVYQDKKLNHFLKKSQPRTGKALLRVRRTKAVANGILSASQTKLAVELIQRLDHSRTLGPYAVEEVAIILCRLVANEGLPRLNSEGYTDDEVAELQYKNKEQMDSRQNQIEQNSPSDFTKNDWLTIKKEIKNQIERLQDVS